MWARRFVRILQSIGRAHRGGNHGDSPSSFEELIGKSVHISLTHLFYDGRLAAQYELYGRIIRIDDSAIVVRLSGSREECLLRRDVRIFSTSNETDLYVRVGSVGVGYRTDLTRCLYLDATDVGRNLL